MKFEAFMNNPRDLPSVELYLLLVNDDPRRGLFRSLFYGVINGVGDDARRDASCHAQDKYKQGEPRCIKLEILKSLVLDDKALWKVGAERFRINRRAEFDTNHLEP